ncbi:uncharacterized protein LOC111691696 [Anoplophora glabripennis]|nr:uncharacterized protein LOC108910054 [Anoplophora glabripennis]XP_023310688.1 uncharacterized protein LOC111691696 [Anoplophora glabripennis]
MVLAVVIFALALAQGIQCAVVDTRELPSISTLPLIIDGQPSLIQTLPAFIEPEIEAMPLPVPEAIVSNPCEICFAYMTDLIDQLTVIAPEIEAHPMPEVEQEPEFVIMPHPMPTVDVVEPEFVIFPHPMPAVEVIGA